MAVVVRLVVEVETNGARGAFGAKQAVVFCTGTFYALLINFGEGLPFCALVDSTPVSVAEKLGYAV